VAKEEFSGKNILKGLKVVLKHFALDFEEPVKEPREPSENEN